MSGIWLFVAFSFLVIGVMAERRLRVIYKRQSDRLVALQERLSVYRNYNRLATLRHDEAQESLNELRKQMADEQEELKRLAVDTEPAQPVPEIFEKFYVFDRTAGRTGKIWHVAVEARDGVPWEGVKNYVIVAETPEEARKRVQDRHPTISGFVVSPAMPLTGTQEPQRMRA